MFLEEVTEEQRRLYKDMRGHGRSLSDAIKSAKGNAIIAEIKRKSPSKGPIRDIDVVDAAEKMQAGGACAISVLTNKHFDGSLDDLRRVRSSVDLPVLRKDFIVDEIQVYEALVYGADAVLLIASILKDGTKDFVKKAHGLGLEALVEVHDKDGLKFALESKAKMIGINNRDLKTLEIDLRTTEKLIPLMPNDKIIVSESGIESRKDVEKFTKLGANAFLIGTAIMESENIEEKVGGLAE